MVSENLIPAEKPVNSKRKITYRPEKFIRLVRVGEKSLFYGSVTQVIQVQFRVEENIADIIKMPTRI